MKIHSKLGCPPPRAHVPGLLPFVTSWLTSICYTMLAQTAHGFRQWHLRYESLHQWQQLVTQRQLLRVHFLTWRRLPRAAISIRCRRFFVFWKRKRRASVLLSRFLKSCLSWSFSAWKQQTRFEREILQKSFAFWIYSEKLFACARNKADRFFVLWRQKVVMRAWIKYHQDMGRIGDHLCSRHLLAVVSRCWNRLKAMQKAFCILRSLRNTSLKTFCWFAWTQYRGLLVTKADQRLWSIRCQKAFTCWKYCHIIYHVVAKVIISNHTTRIKQALYSWKQLLLCYRKLRKQVFKHWQQLCATQMIRDRLFFSIRHHQFHAWLLLYRHRVFFNYRLIQASISRWYLLSKLRYFIRKVAMKRKLQLILAWRKFWSDLREYRHTNSLIAESFHRQRQLLKVFLCWQSLFCRYVDSINFVARRQLKLKAKCFNIWNQQLYRSSAAEENCNPSSRTEACSEMKKQGCDIPQSEAQADNDLQDPFVDAVCRHHYRLCRERACFCSWTHFCRILRFYRKTSTFRNRHHAIRLIHKWNTGAKFIQKCRNFKVGDGRLRCLLAWCALSKQYRQAYLFRRKHWLRLYLRRRRRVHLKRLHFLYTLFFAWREVVSRRCAWAECKKARIRCLLRHWIITLNLKRSFVDETAARLLT